jgi:hypothetical protein
MTGLDRSQWLGDQSTPVYDTGQYRTAIAAGRPDQRPMFTSFTEDGVIWGDGGHEAVDAVIFATGYRPNLPYLTGLGALDKAGRVLQRGGVSLTEPGLYYVGMPRQRTAASATLRGVGADAKVVVTHLRQYSPVRLRGSRTTTGTIVVSPKPHWLSRSGELVGYISLINLALKQQLTTHKVAAPKLMGEALAHSLIVGAGFLGFGHAAQLYTRT